MFCIDYLKNNIDEVLYDYLTLLNKTYHSQSLGPVKFGKWTVTRENDLEYDNGRFVYTKDRFGDEELLVDTIEDQYDLNSFLYALCFACKRLRIQNVGFITYYQSYIENTE